MYYSERKPNNVVFQAARKPSASRTAAPIAIILAAFHLFQLAASAGNNAQFISQSVPTFLAPGQTAAVSVTMKNTGSTTWTVADKRMLGTQNPQDGNTWGFGNRIKLGRTDLIAPGQKKTFAFTIKAPVRVGTYPFQMRMVWEGFEWFGDLTPNVAIAVGEFNDAQFVSQTIPTSLTAGETVSVSVTMKNTGNTTWKAADLIRLGTQNPQDNSTWGFGNRVNLNANESIAPGQQKTFVFTVKAPGTPGTYNFKMRMLREGVEWFGAFTLNVAVTVRTNAATLEALFNRRARFVVDQNNVPLQGKNSGHREAFAVNRPDLAKQAVLLYHRCFIIASDKPEICVARSNDGGTSYGPSTRVITLTNGHFSVAPSVLKIGRRWWMVYEEGGGGAFCADSPDGLTWTKRGALFTEGAATPSLYEFNGMVYLFYAWFVPGSEEMLRIRYRAGRSLEFLGNPVDVFSPSDSGWGTRSVSMPRLVRQIDSSGQVVHYMFFEGATHDFSCKPANKNRYGWGVAKSYDLFHWTPYSGNPIMINQGGCGLDMPNPFIRNDDVVFVFHTSADTSTIVREVLR